MTGRASGATRRGQRRVGARRARWVAAVAALPMAGLLAAGCTSHPAASGSAKAVVTSAKSTTTTTTAPTSAAAPECGSTRDPFDPTDSPAPAGSPARC
jgi:hypothetical protein